MSQPSPADSSIGLRRPETVVESLVHGLAVLGLFSEDAPVLGVGEMARHVDVHRSTASRIAATLSYCGFLVPAGEQGRYRLGPRLVRLGELAAHEMDLPRTAAVELQRLAGELGETVHLGLLDGAEVTTAMVIDGWHTVRMHGTPGKRSPAHCSSLGKALLAGLTDRQLDSLYRQRPLEVRTEATIRVLSKLKTQLRECRRAGYSLDDQELEAGLRCVGAPLLNHSGRVVAAISASGPTTRLQGNALDRAIRAVRATASTISVRLGATPEASFWGPPPQIDPAVPRAVQDSDHN